MAIIILTTEIKADINKCFDLARNIDFHKLSMEKTNEKVIAGRTSGLCELGDTVTWEAFHFWLKQQLTVKIAKFNRSIFFEDEMLKGTFKSMRHEHHFELSGGITIMTDRFEYTAPLGIIGKLFDLIILKNYMTFLLETRNNLLKSLAEGSGT